MSAIEYLDWEDDKKERVKNFCIIEYTSSDESELSEDETGPDVKRFVTKRFAWERLRKLKDLLDLTYKKPLSHHVRNFQTQRVIGVIFSPRGTHIMSLQNGP